MSRHPLTGGRPPTTITILLVDDHDSARRALAGLVDQETDMRLVGEAVDSEMAVRLARELEPDIVLMDVLMPGVNGIETTCRLTEALPRVGVLAISMHSDRRLVEAMLEAGAAGYLLKDNAAEKLAVAVRAVAAGQRYADRDLELPSTTAEPGS